METSLRVVGPFQPWVKSVLYTPCEQVCRSYSESSRIQRGVGASSAETQRITVARCSHCGHLTIKMPAVSPSPDDDRGRR
jgi:hypothetical protein